MKLKYYLRGLGIGIVVTALLMGLSTKGQEPLSDAQIKERAAALGMVDGSTLKLSDLQVPKMQEAEPEQDIKPEQSAEPTKDEDAGQNTEPIKDAEAAEQETEPTKDVEDAGEEAELIKDAEAAESETKQTIVVKRGDSSDRVARNLEKAGLVADAGEFDRYLCSKGYATSISVGTYEIEAGTSEEQIAKIITGKK